ILRKSSWNITATVVMTRRGAKLINIQEGDKTKENYSIVIDIGTTSVYAEVLNICEATTIAESSDYNSQISYGEDVITRIVYSQKKGGLEKLQDKIVGTINGIIEELITESGIDREDITHLVAAGNTTMTQIFLGIDPKYIREAPYIPVASFIPPVRASSLGINIHNNAYIYTFPIVSSYVGGDITAGVLGSGMFMRDELTLYIDVGTNGEIVLGNKDWLVTTSCSAGPAFEGGGVKFGMRATKGAIEQVRIEPKTGEPMILVIGNVKPKGICGSAMIDVVAELLEVGLLGQNGKFYMDAKTDRVRKGESCYEYVVAWADETQIKQDISINEIDIENLIRTKGAIYSGCLVLLNNVGYTIKDIDKFIIAGGFGRYIDVERGISIGLLPEIETEKFTFIGNGSLLGARLVSLSMETLHDASNIAKMMTNIELSNNKMFMDEYISAMFLPHTDLASFKNTMARLEKLWEKNKQIKEEEEK
ncbi:ASKHA domain-containing protein, partial [Thermodesulfobacteriota bacterium]